MKKRGPLPANFGIFSDLDVVCTAHKYSGLTLGKNHAVAPLHRPCIYRPYLTMAHMVLISTLTVQLINFKERITMTFVLQAKLFSTQFL
jgi:hypothetical protein